MKKSDKEKKDKNAAESDDAKVEKKKKSKKAVDAAADLEEPHAEGNQLTRY
jgi:hypothetical protein